MEETKATRTKKSRSSDWHEVFSGLGASFVKNFAESLVDKVRNRIKEIISALQRGILGAFLIATGLIFALIGLITFLNDLLQLGDGMGYALVGVFSILIGLIIIKK